MAIYNVTLLSDKHNINTTIKCTNDMFLLDAAEEHEIDLPYSCRAGACSTCTGKVKNANYVDQSEQTFLDDEQMNVGFILSCVAYPKANCTIQVHQDDFLY